MNIIELNPSRDIHPYEPYITSNTKYLIVGTIPPYKFCVKKDINNDWYYTSETNQFWRILGKVFEDVEINKEQLINFSNRNFLGFIDLFHEVYRHNESSSDQDIIPITYKNIFDYIEKNPSIEAIIFTSLYVEQLSTSLYGKVYKKKYVDRKNQEITISNDRKVKWVRLSSPSLRNSQKLDDKVENWKKIFNLIGQ